MPILCSQKPPVTCHVTQDDSRCPSRTHTSWSSVSLWPRLLLPSASFCCRHLALWVFWAGSFFGALTVSARNALFQVSTWLTAILPSVSPFWTTEPQIATWPPFRPPFPPSLLHFSPWTSLLANILHNSLICFIICILSLPCKLQKGKHLCLFCLVMC